MTRRLLAVAFLTAVIVAFIALQLLADPEQLGRFGILRD